jgi:3-carboxy-cis,cis-muconate cycloisomerase
VRFRHKARSMAVLPSAQRNVARISTTERRTASGERRLLDGLLSAEAMRGVFSDRALIQGMLDFEAALARAEAAVGIIPHPIATAIVSQCRAQLFDLDALSEATGAAGTVAIPLTKALAERVARRNPEAAGYVHWGASGQDAADTALMLQLRAALGLFETGLQRLNDELARLVGLHRSTVMLGRIWLKPGAPLTFGLKVAGWLNALDRARGRLQEISKHALVVQLGGAVGTLAALGPHGVDVATLVARELELSVPDMSWQAQRDRVAEVGAAVGMLAGGLGKLGRDLALLMQTEVAEVVERPAPARGLSSPPYQPLSVGVGVLHTAAIRAPALVAALFNALPQEHERGLGGWHAEWQTLAELCLTTAGALHHAAELVEHLDVDAARMRHNFDAACDAALVESVTLRLASEMGSAAAQDAVARAYRRAVQLNRGLRDTLALEPSVTERFSDGQLERLFDPCEHLGTNDQWIDRVLAAHAARRVTVD